MKTKLFFIFILIVLSINVTAQNLQITNITPAINQNNVNPDANIVIDFDQSIQDSTLNDSTIFIRGSQSGNIIGAFSGGGTSTITINPDNDFRNGEIISLTITINLMSTSGMALLRGYTYSFTTASAPAPASPVSLAQRDIGSVNIQEEGIKTMDFDGDGDLDILTSRGGYTEYIYLLENNGDMGFCSYNTGGNFRNVEVYDIDGDGDYDTFGATGAFDTELNWFENEGTMPFAERFISSEDPWTIVGGDLDSDGDIDVVAPVIIPNRVLWFANDGMGNFSTGMNIPTTFGGGSDSYFYIRDINSDGAMDILAFHRDDRNLVWYQNDGNQNFTEIIIATTADRMRISSADIDGDGDIDIVSVSIEYTPTAVVSWWENDGSENFTEHTLPATSIRSLASVSVTDIDGDSDMDILAGGYWFENDGSENFTEQIISEGLKLESYYYSRAICYADLDSDSDMDAVTLGAYSISWHENTDFLEITSSTPYNASVGVAKNANISITFDQAIDVNTINDSNIRIFSQLKGLITGTFSGGGTNTITFDPNIEFFHGDKIEVSINEKVKSVTGHKLAVTYSISFHTETSPVTQVTFSAHPVITHTDNATGMDVTDIDGDGDLDLVSCSFASELLWHENDGDGNFTTIQIDSTGTPTNVVAFDQNEDGFTDIWVDNSGAGSILYINDGSQNFGDSTITGALSLKQVMDVNADGDLDIVFLSGGLSWRDKSCWGYSSYGFIPDVTNIYDVQAGDLDNDGDIDFITAKSSGPIYFKNNDYFIYSDSSFDNSYTTNVYLSDLDGDGDLDPIFTENYSAIIWYENLLTGDSLSFGVRQQIAPLNQDPKDVIATDIDGDGDPDIAAVSRNDDKVVWYENRLNEPSSDFGPEQIVSGTADGPVKIKSGDLDGDGDTDLITLSQYDDELTWFENTGISTNIKKDNIKTPLVFQLDQNYPNPFNPSTTIEFSIPKTEFVTLKIYNLLGQEVVTLVSDKLVPDNYKFIWDATNFSSGIYFYQLVVDSYGETGDFIKTKKLILLR